MALTFDEPGPEPVERLIHMTMTAYEARLDAARLEGYDEGYDAALEYIDRQNEEANEDAEDYDYGVEEVFEETYDEPMAEEGEDDR